MPVSTNFGLVRRAVLGTGGLALCSGSAGVGLAYLLITVPALVVRAARPRVHAGARTLAEYNRVRVVRYLGGDEEVGDYSGHRAMQYVAAHGVVGLFCSGILILIALGTISAGIIIWQTITGQPVGGGDPPEPAEWTDMITVVTVGSLLLFLAVWGLIGIAQIECAMVRHFLGPRKEELLRRRVSELATSRAGVVEAVNEERRRIERDLHDGVQQRLVALGMLLGRARRATDREHVEDLVRLAHEEAQHSLQDLREVSWRVYPIALDQGGLHAALEAVAERSSVPVRLFYELPERPPDLATETVAYFVVSEAVTNAIKHGAPEGIDITVYRDGSWLVVNVLDDGSGGAQPTGTGLSGLARRVAAADGEFTVDSPPGGPTVVSARLPCG